MLSMGSHATSPFRVVADLLSEYICDCNFNDEGFWVLSSVQSIMAKVSGNSTLNCDGIFRMMSFLCGHIGMDPRIKYICSIHAENISLTD